MTIQMYEWRTGLFPGRDEQKPVTVEVTGEPVLVDDYDGDDMWFEVDVTVNGVAHYAQYNEALLRWESGDR